MSPVGQLRTLATYPCHVRSWGISRRKQRETGHRPANVACWGVSGRAGSMVRMSLLSQQATFEPDRIRCPGELHQLVDQRLRLLQIGSAKPRGEAPYSFLPLAVAYNSDGWAAA